MKENFSSAVWFKASDFTLIWKCHGSLQAYQSEFNGLEYVIKMRLLEKYIPQMWNTEKAD